jgi:spermidine/putrescine transport system substrate-binding protein
MFRTFRNSAFMTRRQFTKGAGALAGTIALTGAVSHRARGQSERVVTLLSWPGHGSQDVIGPFEAATGIKVQAKEYTGGENMLALLESSPPGTFDVVLTDAEYVYQLQKSGLIDELDPSDYPLDDFWPEFQKFPPHWVGDKLYSVMVDFGFLGMVYNTEKLTRQEVDTYGVLWEEKVKGKVGMYDWYLPNMMCLSLYNGNRPPHDIDDARFAELRETLFSLSPQMSGIGVWSSVFSQLTNRESWVMPGVGAWAALLLENDGVPIKAIVPREGGLQWTESLSIAASSKRKDLAVKLIQYLVSPEGQVREATKASYWASIPSKAGWRKLNQDMPKAAERLELTFDKRNVMDEFKEGKIFIRGVPVQQSIGDWNEVWTEFKNM